jgi:site-specific DNA-methyltransferase (adenine-specific)
LTYEIKNGDCLDLIPTFADLGIKSVITDPPYGIGDMVGGYGRGGRTIKNDGDLTVCANALDLCFDTFSDCWIVTFYSSRISNLFFRCFGHRDYFGEMIWDKRAPGMGGGLRYQHENIAIFKNGNPPQMEPCFSVYSVYRSGDMHPHQKPDALMDELVRVFPGPILDPFMGSGSTGLACVRAKKDFYGIELDSDYFSLSESRIESSSTGRQLKGTDQESFF